MDKQSLEAQINEHLEGYLLGVTDIDLPVTSFLENRLITAHMASQAQQRINIISRDLDSKIYSSEALSKSIIQLIKTNPKAEIKILVHDISRMSQHHHQLIELFQRFDSFISIKQINEEFSDYNHAFISVDHTAILFREFADLYDGTANYCNRLLAKTCRLEFTKIWDLSETASSLRSIHL